MVVKKHLVIWYNQLTEQDLEGIPEDERPGPNDIDSEYFEIVELNDEDDMVTMSKATLASIIGMIQGVGGHRIMPIPDSAPPVH